MTAASSCELRSEELAPLPTAPARANRDRTDPLDEALEASRPLREGRVLGDRRPLELTEPGGGDVGIGVGKAEVPIFGGDATEASRGTSRMRKEKCVSPSSKMEVSGKDEKALLIGRASATKIEYARSEDQATHMLSFSSLLILRGGQRDSRSGPFSKSKLTVAKERIQR